MRLGCSISRTGIPSFNRFPDRRTEPAPTNSVEQSSGEGYRRTETAPTNDDQEISYEPVADTSFDHDVAVLGAGAAGLVAAFRVAEVGARVLIVEKNRRPGVKILISGGTRCNITNARGLRRVDMISGPIDPTYDVAQCRGIRAIQQAFGENGAFLGPA